MSKIRQVAVVAIIMIALISICWCAAPIDTEKKVKLTILLIIGVAIPIINKSSIIRSLIEWGLIVFLILLVVFPHIPIKWKW